MKETDFNEKFIEKMREKFPTMWCRKIHGEEMQSNIPDFLFCINGVFVAIEFKVQRDGRISSKPMQLRELSEIKNAKGIALIIAYDENRNKILMREKRVDYKKAMSRYIRMDWDFEFNHYEQIIDVIGVMVENKQ